MDNSIILKLTMDNPNATGVDRLVNIYHLLSQILVFKVPGAIIELGCNEGKTSLFLRMIIDHFAPDRELHVYDSFQGLPQKSQYDHLAEDTALVTKQKFAEDAARSGLNMSYDETLTAGGLKAIQQQLEDNFQRWKLTPPIIHAGWFENTLPYYLPQSIAFAYLDSDFYDSILVSLEHIYPRLSPNAIVIVDDYCDSEKNPHAWSGLPGVKKACDFFLLEKPEKMYVLVGSDDLTIGYFRKL
jgi:O-methyltransferase